MEVGKFGLCGCGGWSGPFMYGLAPEGSFFSSPFKCHHFISSHKRHHKNILYPQHTCFWYFKDWLTAVEDEWKTGLSKVNWPEETALKRILSFKLNSYTAFGSYHIGMGWVSHFYHEMLCQKWIGRRVCFWKYWLMIAIEKTHWCEVDREWLLSFSSAE